MTKIRAILGSLMAVVVVVGGVVFEAPQASATRGPIVISYEKTCVSGVRWYRRARRHDPHGDHRFPAHKLGRRGGVHGEDRGRTHLVHS